MIQNLLITVMFVPALAQAFCFAKAASTYGLDEDLLRAVAHVESSMNPSAMNMSHVKRTSSYGIGLMQIDSRWIPKLNQFGITEDKLKSDACQNLLVGAWIMKDALSRQGDNWWGVGSYNASCKTLNKQQCESARYSYAWKVYRAMKHVRGESIKGTPQKATVQLAKNSSGSSGRSSIESVLFEEVPRASIAHSAHADTAMTYAVVNGQVGDGEAEEVNEFAN